MDRTNTAGPIWGEHLAVDYVNTTTPFVDAHGNRFRSIRDAFWRGRLGMGDHSREITEAIMETIHAALVARAFHRRLGKSEATDIYGGSIPFGRFVFQWLYSLGFIADRGSGDPAHGEVSEEGMAVIRMLEATRPVNLALQPLGRTSVAALNDAIDGPEVGEERRMRVEEVSAGWPSRFVRRTIADKPTIVLVCHPEERSMRVKRTVWTLTFGNETIRNDTFDWLCDHVDRWDEWARTAYRGGGAALTRHLLTIMSSDMAAGNAGSRSTVQSTAGVDSNLLTHRG